METIDSMNIVLFASREDAWKPKTSTCLSKPFRADYSLMFCRGVKFDKRLESMQEHFVSIILESPSHLLWAATEIIDKHL